MPCPTRSLQLVASLDPHESLEGRSRILHAIGVVDLRMRRRPGLEARLVDAVDDVRRQGPARRLEDRRLLANHAPAGANKTIAVLEDTPYTFVAADFGFSDPSDTPANNFLAV